MKVTYEFNPDDNENNDKFEIELIHARWKMYRTITAVSEIIRQVNKGWIEADLEKVLEKISDEIYDNVLNTLEE